LDRRGGSLAELATIGEYSSTDGHSGIATKGPPSTPLDSSGAGNGGETEPLPRRLLAVSLALGGGPGHRVRLSDLRHALSDVSRGDVDRTLLDLQRQEKLVLYRIDDPTDIRPEDERAALMVAGNPRHIVYLEP
jgi:hypothetical protein